MYCGSTVGLLWVNCGCTVGVLCVLLFIHSDALRNSITPRNKVYLLVTQCLTVEGRRAAGAPPIKIELSDAKGSRPQEAAPGENEAASGDIDEELVVDGTGLAEEL